MALGSGIIISAGGGAPRGLFDEGFLGADSGTLKAGIIMEMDDNIAAVGGRFAWQPYGTTAGASGQGVENDGDRKIIAILLPYDTTGGVRETDQTTGSRCKLYYPAMGEELNMLLKDVSGTGDDYHIGEEMMVEDGTGKLLSADNNAEAQPFQCLEVITDPVGDNYMHVRFNGSAS